MTEHENHTPDHHTLPTLRRATLAIIGGAVLGTLVLGALLATLAGQTQATAAATRALAAAQHTLHAQGTALAQVTATAQAQATQAAADAAATATAQASAPSGVHICSEADYDTANVLCTSDDFVVKDTSATRYVVSGPQGGDFTSGSVTLIIHRQNGDGSETTLGSYTNPAIDMTSTRFENTLDSLFSNADVQPEAGVTYQISAQQPDTSLGNTTFTLAGN